jgi:hypothetical protein
VVNRKSTSLNTLFIDSYKIRFLGSAHPKFDLFHIRARYYIHSNTKYKIILLKNSIAIRYFIFIFMKMKSKHLEIFKTNLEYVIIRNNVSLNRCSLHVIVCLFCKRNRTECWHRMVLELKKIWVCGRMCVRVWECVWDRKKYIEKAGA